MDTSTHDLPESQHLAKKKTLFQALKHIGVAMLNKRTAAILLDLFEKKKDATHTQDNSPLIPSGVPYRENYIQDWDLTEDTFRKTIYSPGDLDITQAQLQRTTQYMEQALGELKLNKKRLKAILGDFYLKFDTTSHLAADRLILGIEDDYETIRATILQLPEQSRKITEIYTTIQRITGTGKQPHNILLESSDTLSCADITATLTRIENALDILGTEKDMSGIDIIIQSGHFLPPHNPYIYSVPGRVHVSQDIHSVSEPKPDLRIAQAIGNNEKSYKPTEFKNISTYIIENLIGVRLLASEEEAIAHISVWRAFKRLIAADEAIAKEERKLTRTYRGGIKITCSGTRSLADDLPLLRREEGGMRDWVIDIPHDINTDPIGYGEALFQALQDRNHA